MTHWDVTNPVTNTLAGSRQPPSPGFSPAATPGHGLAQNCFTLLCPHMQRVDPRLDASDLPCDLDLGMGPSSHDLWSL